MTEVYRRLAEGLPSGHRDTLPFAADARRAAEWVEALPRADSTMTRRALLKALSALATAVDLRLLQVLGDYFLYRHAPVIAAPA